MDYKQNSRLEERRKKTLDLHLSYIVDQTEKYSTWLTEGLATAPSTSSVAGSSSIAEGKLAQPCFFVIKKVHEGFKEN